MPGAEGGSSAPRRWLEVTGSAELRAAVDRVIPADEWPGGWEGGVGEYLAECGTELQWALDAMERLVDELKRRGFAVAEPDEQDRVLREISEQQTLRCRLRWTAPTVLGRLLRDPAQRSRSRSRPVVAGRPLHDRLS